MGESVYKEPTSSSYWFSAAAEKRRRVRWTYFLYMLQGRGRLLPLGRRTHRRQSHRHVSPPTCAVQGILHYRDHMHDKILHGRLHAGLGELGTFEILE